MKNRHICPHGDFPQYPGCPDCLRVELASVTEERDSLKRALNDLIKAKEQDAMRWCVDKDRANAAEQQLAASREAHKDCLIVPRTISDAEADCLGMPIRLYEKAVRYGAARTYTWTTDPPAALSASTAKEG